MYTALAYLPSTSGELVAAFMMMRNRTANTPDASQMNYDQDREFENLLAEELHTTADHQLAPRLSGLEIDDQGFVLRSKYATNLGNKQSLGTDEEWDDTKALYGLIHDYNIAAQTLSGTPIPWMRIK